MFTTSAAQPPCALENTQGGRWAATMHHGFQQQGVASDSPPRHRESPASNTIHLAGGGARCSQVFLKNDLL